MYDLASYESPLGMLTLAGSGDCLVGLWFQRQSHYLASLAPQDCRSCESPVLTRAMQWLDAYFSGRQPTILSLPLYPEGTPFRRLVWHILCQIPYGQVRTYGSIAEEVASRQGKDHMSAQAIGGAVGHNPISIIIPCHRVVGAGGNLTGYAGGIDKKRQLLQHEGVDLSGLKSRD